MICAIAYFYGYTPQEIGELDIDQCNALLEYVGEINRKMGTRVR